MTIYRQDPAYTGRAAADGYPWTVHHASGRSIRMDQPVYAIWEAADGRDVDAVCQAVGQSRSFVHATLETLRQGGILHAAGEPAVETRSPTPPFASDALVTVLVLNYNGLEHLETCLTSLRDQTYPHVEVVLVDNNSSDDSVPYVRARFPEVRVLALDRNYGFTGGNNRGLEIAQGRYVLLLNNDTEMDARCVEEMVRVMEGGDHVAAVVPKMCFFDLRQFINGIGNSVQDRDWGSDSYIGYLDLGQFDDVREVPSACFGVVLLSRAALETVGLPDEEYFIYYDDAGWSFRARMHGWHILAAPQALVYHKFSATMGRVADFKLRLAARNRLRYAFKNLEFANFLRFAWNYGREDLFGVLGGIRGRRWGNVRAYLGAWSAFIRSLPRLVSLRRRTQRGRKVPDRDILVLARHIPPPLIHGPSPVLTSEAIRDHYMHLETIRGSTCLLIVSPDVVGTRMAGPGMRYWEFARTLAAEIDVTLAVPEPSDLTPQDLRIVDYREDQPDSLTPHLHESDVVLISGYLVNKFPILKDIPQPIIADVYTPWILENMEIHQHETMADQVRIHRHGLGALNDLIRTADFFVCASKQQRDFWLGVLTANGRVEPRTYADDRTLRRLIDVVPFGLSTQPPRHTKPVLKDVHPGIATTDRLLLWGGGIWDWLDPLTPIRALAQVVPTHPEFKLFFMGTRHPYTAVVPASRMAARARELSQELGLLDRHVFFAEWTPYEERENYLLEADVGLSFHGDHVETHFSFRTRLLDYIWAGLPMIVTRGDALSQIVEHYGLGRTVDYGDVQGLAQAMAELLETPDLRATYAPAFARAAQDFTWERVTEPIAAFCRSPWHAADRRRESRVSSGVFQPRATPAGQLPRKAWDTWRTRGAGSLLGEIRSYLQWKLGR